MNVHAGVDQQATRRPQQQVHPKATRPFPSRLMAAGPAAGLAAHLATFGPLYADAAASLPGMLEAAGLTGRGGAAFATWHKALSASRSGRPGNSGKQGAVAPVVIANGAEGEPLSFKDRTLLANAPHLVIDGLLAVGRAVSAAQVYIYASSVSLPGVARAVAERPGSPGIVLVEAPPGFISGEASAVVNYLATGAAIPFDKQGRLSETGFKGQPAVVLNVETLAHIALIARYGPDWFREVGTPEDPGTRLASVSGGAPEDDVVLELPGGAVLTDVLLAAGTNLANVSAVLVGGYHGRWVRPEPYLISPFGPAHHVVRPGAGVIHSIAAGQCGLQVTAGMARYLAGESAKQCGPCMFGLPAMASVFERLAAGVPDPRLPTEVDRLAALVAGRGACRHPDGTARLVTSALDVFSDDVQAHLSGRCLSARRN
ncbi:MAG TPA: NADH-ubiquinone oxidoreductase-F iron-sulfur binding region domain-containing protein [Arthrobacter sp.]|nr:NADH-ubiquinone oxidoreductase-F iron-sulfur binding region domain-containing protein [Arthrobacter sp.]